MGNIVYRLHDRLYLNITNKCSCNCDFCIRKNGNSVGTANSLWLEQEPKIEEIQNAVRKEKIAEGEEIVFCGYGEPTCAFPMLIKTADYLKRNYNAYLRINTNGQGNLIAGKDIVPEMKGYIDSVSISMNASDPEKYQEIVHSVYGKAAYDEMLKFAESCQKNGIATCFTVVDVIGKDEIHKCQKIADGLGIKLRVREHVKDNTEY